MINNDKIDKLLISIKNNEQPHISVEDIYDLCYYLKESDRLDDADLLSSYGLILYPETSSILILRAIILCDFNRFEQALSVLNYLKPSESENSRLYLAYGWYYLKQELIDDAILNFNTAIEKCGNDNDKIAEIAYEIGINLNQNGYFEQSIYFFEKYKNISTDDDIANLDELAYAYGQIGRYDDSIDIYKKITTQDPLNDTTWFNMGIVYCKKSEHQNAINAYNTAISINPLAADSYYNLAYVYFYISQYDEAIINFTEYLSLTNNNDINPTAYLYIGECWFEKNIINLAYKFFELTCKKMPDNVMAMHMLGLSYIEMGEYVKALVTLTEAQTLDPTNSDIIFAIAQTYDKLCQHDKMIESLERGLTLAPDEIYAWFELFKQQFWHQKQPFDFENFITRNKNIYGNIPSVLMMEAFFDWTIFDKKNEALDLLVTVANKSEQIFKEATNEPIAQCMFTDNNVKQYLQNKGIKL